MTPRKNIVLVVGAGASHDVEPEMGTGKDLIQNISDRVTDRTALARGENGYLVNLLEKLNQNEITRKKFVRLIDKYKSIGCSVDYFLNEVREKHPEIIDDFGKIGTFSIAFEIFGYEGACLRNASFNKPSWLEELNKFIEQYRLNTWSDRLVDLKIVTFNYDRLIEEFLFRKHGQAIKEFVDNSVVHVYNKIAPLGWQEEDKAQFDNGFLEFGHRNDDIEGILRYKEFVILMYDKRNNSNPHLQKSKEFLSSADSILFLGYGYDKYNNKNLGLPTLNGKMILANYYIPEWNDTWKKKYEEFKSNNEIWGTQRDGIIFTTETCTNFIRHWLPKAAEL